ncbi:hypothetical protein [Allobranchiibius sp. CTAmp26]|uniref:hypothetical protein n=1 Tax=Allobranchiibius sp. CTAmp26 TaxID=2815214 RepID=UPI001AA11E89|nr:hypothetical protein [Allobranchiibius sp. CTAmp26]MBO1755758.1 hypothetical protein [Allobranchiibius sp. CTAmp26]
MNTAVSGAVVVVPVGPPAVLAVAVGVLAADGEAFAEPAAPALPSAMATPAITTAAIAPTASVASGRP